MHRQIHALPRIGELTGVNCIKGTPLISLELLGLPNPSVIDFRYRFWISLPLLATSRVESMNGAILIHHDLTDADWQVVEGILLERKPEPRRRGQRGCRRAINRDVINGIFWKLRTGLP